MKFRMYNLFYFFRLAFQGIFRNGFMSFAAVIVLISSLIVTGSAWALKENVEYNLNELNQYNKIVVFAAKEAEEHTVVRLKEKIEALDSVESVEWVTKAEALERIYEQYGAEYRDIFDMYGEDNPLKDELIVTYKGAANVDALVYKIQNMSEEGETMKAVEKIIDRQETAHKIDSIKSAASIVFTWLMILLFLVSVFIIINTIKLAIAARGEEISIMRYIGASRLFVALPFILEGIILGLFAAAVSFGLQYYIYQTFAVDFLGNSTSGIISILPFSSVLKVTLILYLGIGVGLGVLGSWISLRRYNRA